MAVIHRLLFHAAQRLVTDPRVREKAAELIETEVKPRVRDAWQQAKPAALTPPNRTWRRSRRKPTRGEKPKEFAVRVKQRLFQRKRSD